MQEKRIRVRILRILAISQINNDSINLDFSEF